MTIASNTRSPDLGPVTSPNMLPEDLPTLRGQNQELRDHNETLRETIVGCDTIIQDLNDRKVELEKSESHWNALTGSQNDLIHTLSDDLRNAKAEIARLKTRVQTRDETIKEQTKVLNRTVKRKHELEIKVENLAWAAELVKGHKPSTESGEEAGDSDQHE